jgi:hypothetical protein
VITDQTRLNWRFLKILTVILFVTTTF